MREREGREEKRSRWGVGTLCCLPALLRFALTSTVRPMIPLGK